MIGEDAALNLLERALTLSTAQQTDVYLSSQDLGLTRFRGQCDPSETYLTATLR